MFDPHSIRPDPYAAVTLCLLVAVMCVGGLDRLAAAFCPDVDAGYYGCSVEEVVTHVVDLGRDCNAEHGLARRGCHDDVFHRWLDVIENGKLDELDLATGDESATDVGDPDCADRVGVARRTCYDDLFRRSLEALDNGELREPRFFLDAGRYVPRCRIQRPHTPASAVCP